MIHIDEDAIHIESPEDLRILAEHWPEIERKREELKREVERVIEQCDRT